MSRDRGKRLFLVAAADIADDRQVTTVGNEQPLRIPDFLKDAQFVSLGNVMEEDACQRLLHGLEKEGLKKQDFKLPSRPYPGLEPFQETDAAVYFGRDSEIDQVIAILNRRRRNNAPGFILVLGASGCGKSSLVRAGVLPWLRRAGGDDDGRMAWVVVPPLMGGKGLDGLALSLEKAFKTAGQPRDLDNIRKRRATVSDLRTIGSKLRLAHDATEGLVLLVLDQLEEVFGTPEESDARAMLRLLLDTSADDGSSVVILATMRSDFLNAFQLFEGVAEKYTEVTLDPMPRSRFSEVIEGPAERFGLDLDSGLAEQMVEETAYNDALPLLAFTLEKLYEACKARRWLTLQAYDALGGVDASVKHVADAILKESGYADLPADDERMRDLRRAFYRLAQVGQEGQFTRRIARWSQMPDACKPLLQRFVNQRLLVSDTANGETVLSVAHEALFRVWDTLNRWLREDRKALALRSQIEDAAAQWHAENRAASRAWPEERILDAVRVIEDSGVSLDDVADLKIVSAFLGPTNLEDLGALPGLGAADDAGAGSGRYGDTWRLPLGHQARASVGDRLAILGDRRKGVGLRPDGLPDIEWVRIEGGEVTIEICANTADVNSKVVRRLTREVASFSMARYPVTTVQFRAFLDECHGEEGWRLPQGSPFDFGAWGWPPPKHRARHGNHPADSVNWYDSIAFCYWLSTRLGMEVRLPTEFEWQQAATGGDPARIYPWGAEWDPEQEPWRANTFESGLGRSTAVGMYPAGASPADVLDLAGTLWEWCLDPFESSKTRGETWFGRLLSKRSVEEDRRVLRGGSWNDFQGFARSAFRLRFNPLYRFNNIGFCVVCSSPSPNH
jgi:formylglycine-generating enzyme required for sulfatase activity